MTTTALLKFSQGSTLGVAGRAFVAVIGATVVTVENASNTDVNSYLVELLYAPPDSPTYSVAPGTPLVLAAGNGTPTATLDVSALGIYGCYRIRLTVWPQLNRVGAPDVDIRNVAVATPSFGIIIPPYQKFPDPIVLVGVGSKPDELNFDGQPYGWAGAPYDSVTYPWRLLHSALKLLEAGTPVAVGSAASDGVAVTLARSDHVHPHGSQVGGSTHDAGTLVSAGFITPAMIATINAAPSTDDIPHWRDLINTDFTAQPTQDFTAGDGDYTIDGHVYTAYNNASIGYAGITGPFGQVSGTGLVFCSGKDSAGVSATAGAHFPLTTCPWVSVAPFTDVPYGAPVRVMIRLGLLSSSSAGAVDVLVGSPISMANGYASAAEVKGYVSAGASVTTSVQLSYCDNLYVGAPSTIASVTPRADTDVIALYFPAGMAPAEEALSLCGLFSEGCWDNPERLVRLNITVATRTYPAPLAEYLDLANYQVNLVGIQVVKTTGLYASIAALKVQAFY